MATYTVSAHCKHGTDIVFDRVCHVATQSTISDLYNSNIENHPEKDQLKLVSVKVGDSKSAPGSDIGLSESISTLQDLGWRYVCYSCERSRVDDDVVPVPVPPVEAPRRNALTMLMTQARGLALPRTKNPPVNKKDEMYNNIVRLLEEKKLGFPATIAECEGSYTVRTITNVLWSITSHHGTINTKAAHHQGIIRVPEMWSPFKNCFDWRKSKRKRPEALKSIQLKMSADSLFSLLSKPSLASNAWTEVREAIQELGTCLSGYSQYLTGELNETQKRRCLLHPPRQVGTNSVMQYIPRVRGPISPQFVKLDKAVLDSNDDYVIFNEDIHSDAPLTPSQRYHMKKTLRLSVDVEMLSYSPGGSHTTVMILKKVAPDRSTTDIANDAVNFFESTKQHLPTFHTREMKRVWKEKYTNVATISPHTMRSMYQTLTLDAAVDQNPLMDARLRMALLGEPDIIVDLRKLNKGRPGDTYNNFFEEMAKEIEEVTAADDRRHGVAHMSQWISIPDLIKKVEERLPEGTAIPSPALVRLQFMPRNRNSNASMTFTKRFQVQYKIQRRQLRSTHPDSHYCNALFKYVRDMAVKYKDACHFLCMDDKSKVSFGEPGTAMASGVRGRQMLAPTTSTLSAADHDQSGKGHLTPSVILNVDVPDDSSSSFCQGQVVVSVNDAIFQQSTPFRHAASIRRFLQTKPMALIFTDGGPDHRLTYESVKMSLIAVFRATNLDLLVAARCAPGQSWTNPVERIMSLLNLGLQNVSLERDASTEAVEALLKKCSSMDGIRKLAAANAEVNVKEAWTETIASMVGTIRSRFERLKLKDEPVVTTNPVTTDQVGSLHDFILQLDENVDFNQLQKRFLVSKKDYQRWVDTHCRAGHYSFQVRKCQDRACCGPRQLNDDQLHWLPDPVPDASGDHYKAFNEVYGTVTTGEHRPSLQPFQGRACEDDQGCKTSLLTAQRAKRMIRCQECQKPRVVYSNNPKKLTRMDLLDIDRAILDNDYTCGSPLLPVHHRLFGKVFVRIGLTCGNTIEQPFYASSIGIPDVCCHCGGSGASRPQELVSKYKTVLPVCETCLESGKKHVTARPRPGQTHT